MLNGTEHSVKHSKQRKINLSSNIIGIDRKKQVYPLLVTLETNMKIKSLGFSITNPNPNVSIEDVFNEFISSSTHVHHRTDDSRQVLVSDDADFYTGLILTYKNQKKNCKSKIKNGKFTVKVEDLKGDEKLVNFNFFCIKKSSLKGLYFYHHGSCSLSNLFSIFQTKSNEHIRSLETSEISLLGEKPKQKDVTAIHKKYKERLGFSLILSKQKIETILARFKKINKATFKFSSIDFEQGSMSAVQSYVRDTDVVFNINTEDRHKTSPIARALNGVFTSMDNIRKAKVVAVDHSNNEKIVDFFNCPTFFDEFDFDTLASHVDGLTNDNYTSNQIVAIIKEQIVNGNNKNVFN